MPPTLLEIDAASAARDTGGVLVGAPKDPGNLAECRDCEEVFLRSELQSVDVRFYQGSEKVHQIPLRLCPECWSALLDDMQAIRWSNDLLRPSK